MQKTYTSYSELKGNTLNYGDLVIFDKTLEYAVSGNHLANRRGTNDDIFRLYDISKEKKEKLASVVYGYPYNGGCFPVVKNNDYKALTRLTLVLFALVEGKSEIGIKIDGKDYIVDIKRATKKLVQKPTVNDQLEIAVSIKFIKEAHAAACNEWKKKIETEFPNIFQTEKEYGIGTRVMIETLISGRTEYMLVSVGDNQCTLINTKEGTLWSTPHMNLEDSRITHSQLKKYIGAWEFSIKK